MKTKVGYFRNARYTFKFLREISSFVIALYGIYLLLKLLSYNNKSYMILFSSPLQIAIAIIVMIFALIHSISWFYLMPKIIRIKINKKYINSEIIFASSLLIFILISIILIIALI
ncbi:MAG: hypothetical protein RQ952_02760 [Thermoproteota archaeon]|jgi:fumarate reductase subunit C|nr:hypothetical protein [Thermoproteota archaeon]